jgi:Kdo2-lipid IVA lauroyltransferase/acyltransferase
MSTSAVNAPAPQSPPSPSAGRRERAAVAVADRLLGVLERLPERRALALAAGLCRAWAKLGGPRTQVARENLRIAFPGWSEAEREAVLVRSFENIGRSVAEFARLGRLGPEALRERVQLEGLEHVEAARAQSKTGGVVAITGHFGSWEMLAAAMAAHGYPFVAVQKPRESPLLDAIVERYRRAGGAEFLARGNAALSVMRSLAEGKAVAILYDQDAPKDEGVFVPFFGRLACTRDGPVKIALRARAPVLPVFLHRVGTSSMHVARFRAPIPMVRGHGMPLEEAIRENARRMTAAIEDEIREAPDHWSWVHRRWKTQPPGEPAPASY